MRGKRLPQTVTAARVIVAGLAGGLDPRLRAGDLVLDSPLPDLPLHLPWHIGPIYTTDRLVTTPADKAALFRDTKALAVDMEQAVVQKMAEAEVTIIGLRAISDPADMTIDPAVLNLVDEIGRPRPLAVMTTLLRRPGLIRHLRELNANSKLALRNLGLGVAALVEQFPRSHDSR